MTACSRLLLFVAVSASLLARQNTTPLLVKGAWSSATGSTTPLPEAGTIVNGSYTNDYFGFSYSLPTDWLQKSAGPPPSDSGRYVLTLLRPAATVSESARGSILVTAQDMFFTPFPAASAMELINYTKSHLQPDYQLEQEPTQSNIGGRIFTSLAYWSPVTELHWHVLATAIRCHTVEFVFMNRDPKTLQRLVLEMNKMKFSTPAGTTSAVDPGPVCLSDYARGANVLERVEPLFVQHKYNPVPVRIIIDKEGRVKHIHFLSAFPDQAKAVTDALAHWKFRPYLQDGNPVEVETGILFGRAPRLATSSGAPAIK